MYTVKFDIKVLYERIITHSKRNRAKKRYNYKKKQHLNLSHAKTAIVLGKDKEIAYILLLARYKHQFRDYQIIMEQDNLSIRQKAEESLKNKKSRFDLSEIDKLKLIHELEVHQIELELQNEELLLAKERAEIAAEKAEAATQKYTDLYDFAPSGYFTLSKEGNILGLNHRGAQMLGKERLLIINSWFGFFVTVQTRQVFNSFLKEVFSGKANEVREVCLSANEDIPKYVQLTGIRDENMEQCHVNAIDITERKKTQDALDALALRDKTILQMASDGIHILDENGNVVEANDSFCRLSGYTREELLRMNAAELYAEWSNEDLLVKINELINHSGVFETKLRTDRGEGYRYVEINATGVTIENRKYLYASARDITERIKAQEEISKLHKAVEQAPVSIVITNHYGNIEYVNPRFCSLTGYTREEAFGNNPRILKSGNTTPEIYQELWSRLLSGKEWVGEFQNKKKNGDLYWESANISTILDSERNITHFVAVKEDITERKQKEEELRQSNQRLQAIISASPDGVGIISFEGKLQLMSDKLIEMYGYSIKQKDEMFGKNALEFIDPPYHEKFTDSIRKLIAGKRGNELEQYLAIKKDGSRFFIETNSCVLYDSFGNSESILFVQRDVTEHRLMEDAIRESEAKHSSMIANISDVIAIMGIDGIMKYKSPNIEKWFGWQPRDLVGTNGWETVHPDDLDRIQKEFYSLLEKDNATTTVVYKYKCKDGSYKPIELTAKNLVNDPLIGGVIMNYRDITERKRMEDAIRESEAKHSSMIANISDVIVIMGIDGVMKYRSPNIEKWFGWPQQDIVGLNGWDTIHPDDLERLQIEFSSIIEKDNAETTVVFRYKCKDGSYKPVELSAKNLANDPVIGGVIMNYRDITERKQAEEALQRSERFINAVLGALSAHIAILDENCIIIGVNRAWRNFAGANSDGTYNLCEGANYLAVCDAGSFYFSDSIESGAFAAGIRSMLKGERDIFELEYPCHSPNEKRWFIGRITRFVSDGNISLVVSHENVTLLKLAEEEIIESNIKLEKANSEKDKFFSIIAHDLRSPFTGLLGLTELMTAKDKMLSIEEFVQMSKLLRKSVVNVYQLLENLLEWAIVQKDMVDFTPKELRLSDVFLQSIKSIEERARQKEITIFRACPDSIGESTEVEKIFADEKMISTVIRNLLTNAVKFTERGGKVTVRANETQDGMIEISVTDTGVGIRKDVIDKLFIVGEKVGTTGTENEPSTGLGLILCKEFIEKHGGKIWVESKEGVGSTFYFTIQKNNC